MTSLFLSACAPARFLPVIPIKKELPKTKKFAGRGVLERVKIREVAPLDSASSVSGADQSWEQMVCWAAIDLKTNAPFFLIFQLLLSFFCPIASGSFTRVTLQTNIDCLSLRGLLK